MSVAFVMLTNAFGFAANSLKHFTIPKRQPPYNFW